MKRILTDFPYTNEPNVLLGIVPVANLVSNAIPFNLQSLYSLKLIYLAYSFILKL